MAYMPLDKSKLYLDRTKMTRIYDLSQPWGVDTPLWPFPGPRADLQFPRGQYLERFHKRTCTIPARCTRPRTVTRPTTPCMRKKLTVPATAIP
jgi:hypothetical protein